MTTPNSQRPPALRGTGTNSQPAPSSQVIPTRSSAQVCVLHPPPPRRAERTSRQRLARHLHFTNPISPGGTGPSSGERGTGANSPAPRTLLDWALSTGAPAATISLSCLQAHPPSPAEPGQHLGLSPCPSSSPEAMGPLVGGTHRRWEPGPSHQQRGTPRAHFQGNPGGKKQNGGEILKG